MTIAERRPGRHHGAVKRWEDALLQGKIAWITGAGSGIGEAGALALAEAGATIVLSGRRAEQLQDVTARITSTGGTAEIAPLDVADKEGVARTGADIIARHGRVDILVNSAGLNLPTRFWRDATPDTFDHVVGVNLNGALYCIAAVLPTMRAQQDGLVINISSWAGRFETYLTGPAYNASKHALVALTHSLNDEECANGIRACVICPGEVATPILRHRPTPPGEETVARMLQAEDLGRTIRFVAEMPPRVCLNEILITPTWNRFYLGGTESARR
jgi:NADP-dependent 3-hydroxy acid dehydrogenase YdfG